MPLYEVRSALLASRYVRRDGREQRWLPSSCILIGALAAGCGSSAAQDAPDPEAVVSTRGEQTLFSLAYDDRIVAVFVFSAAHSPLAVSDACADPAVFGVEVGFVGPLDSPLQAVPDLDTKVGSLELDEAQLAAVVAAIPAPACDPIEFSRADIQFDVAAPRRHRKNDRSVSEAPIVRTEIGDNQSPTPRTCGSGRATSNCRSASSQGGAG